MLHDSPVFTLTGGLQWLLLVVLAVVLLTVWTAWRAYRQPTSTRLMEHGVLLLLWLWPWVLSGPRYQAQWDSWLPIFYLGHVLLLAGRVAARRWAR